MRSQAPLLVALAVALFAPITFGGSLHGAQDAGVVHFNFIRQVHFDALKVSLEEGAPATSPLVLRVTPLGDAAGAVDLSEAEAFLARELNVRVVWTEDGMPVYLTLRDLAAKSGRATLGATVSNGMAVEARDRDVVNCVFAHEVGHVLGLKHNGDPASIMSEHCTRGKLAASTVTLAEVLQVARVDRMVAHGTGGAVLWADRA